MRHRIARLLVTATVAGGLAVVPATSSPAAPVHSAAVARHCPSGFVKANIGGATKCLHAGEYCAKRYQRQYRRHGFKCTRGRLRYS